MNLDSKFFSKNETIWVILCEESVCTHSWSIENVPLIQGNGWVLKRNWCLKMLPWFREKVGIEAKLMLKNVSLIQGNGWVGIEAKLIKSSFFLPENVMSWDTRNRMFTLLNFWTISLQYTPLISLNQGSIFQAFKMTFTRKIYFLNKKHSANRYE